MPDFTIQYSRVCLTEDSWFETVPGKKGVEYTVRYDRWNHKNSGVQYDFSCTCPSYQFGRGKYCKHIEQVWTHRCGWNQFIHGDDSVRNASGEEVCPRCGGPTRVEKNAV